MMHGDARFSLREKFMEMGSSSYGDTVEAATDGDVVPEVLAPGPHSTSKDANVLRQNGCHEQKGDKPQELFSSSNLRSAYVFAFPNPCITQSQASGFAEFLSFQKLIKDAATFVHLGEFPSHKDIRLEFLQATLPAAIKRCLEENATVLLGCNDSNVHIFETLCDFVELVVAILSRSRSSLCTSVLVVSLQALADILDTESGFPDSVVTVHAERLKSVLMVPGFRVCEYGDATRRIHFFCSKRNYVGSFTCECCPPKHLDQAETSYLHNSTENEDEGFAYCDSEHVNLYKVSYLASLFERTTYGNGYEHILGVLSQPEPFSIEVVEALLHPFSKIATMIPLEFVKGVADVCERLLVYLEGALKAIINTSESVPIVAVRKFNATKSSVEEISKHLFAIVSSLPTPHVAKTLTTQMQYMIWDMMLQVPQFWICAVEEISMVLGTSQELNAAGATSTEMHQQYASVIQWLEGRSHVSNIIELSKYRPEVHSTKVSTFFRLLIKDEKLQEDHVNQIWACKATPGLRKRVTPGYEQLRFDLFHDFLDTPLSQLERQLETLVKWLEHITGTSVGCNRKTLTIIGRVAQCDKQRIMKERMVTLFWGHLARNENLYDIALAPLTEILEHYQSAVPCSDKDLESLKKSLSTSLGRANFLEALRKADITQPYAKAKLWELLPNFDDNKEEKTSFLEEAECKLQKMRHVNIPKDRKDLAQEHLQRLEQIATLMSGVNTSQPTSSVQILEEFEMKILETIRCESQYHCKVGTELDKLHEKQKVLCDILTNKQHNEMMKFLQNCVTERESTLQKALLLKATIMTCTREANLPNESDTKLLHKAVTLLKEMEAKRKEENNKKDCLLNSEKYKKEVLSKELDKTKEKLPNKACAICTEGFKKRKRACFSPCGHASVCTDCAKQEWERTKQCPMCNTALNKKPITLPSKLYF